MFVIVYLFNASFVVMGYQFVNGLLFTIAGMLASQNLELARIRPIWSSNTLVSRRSNFPIPADLFSIGSKMRKIAYIANVFPSAVEPYVMQEIAELRRRGIAVIPCSARRPTDSGHAELKSWVAETLYLQPLQLDHSIRAAWLCVRKLPLLCDILARLLSRHESPGRRLKAILHTFLGAYLAVLLETAEVDHIQVHHGYFSLLDRNGGGAFAWNHLQRNAARVRS